jgi:N-acetylglucosaminyldiphosphoundecaprenol N-acetyl-beta-D-mannosaminyltransferase
MTNDPLSADTARKAGPPLDLSTVPVFRFAGANIHNVTSREAVELVLELVQAPGCTYVVTPNSDHLVQLQIDRLLQVVYRDASLVLADGMPLVWASRILGEPLKERVTGADLLPSVCERAAQKGLAVFFLGAPPGVARQAADKLVQTYSGLQVTGCYSPPYGFENDPEECQRIVEMINASGARLVFVGLGAPKQEYWMHRYRAELNAGVLLGIGAAIEFAAGSLARAPAWMQKAGLEWFYRLLREPKRLALRYLRDFKVFALIGREWRDKRRRSSGNC